MKPLPSSAIGQSPGLKFFESKQNQIAELMLSAYDQIFS